LDYNATTPLDPEVRKAIKRSIDEDWANPSSGMYILLDKLNKKLKR
jgi:cysteine sulfinate desulfinase/cysteine desulfurase-like protein